MARSKAQSSAVVGAFVLVALAILAAGMLWITGSSALFGKRVPYTILLRDSVGIEPGDRVRVAGVSIGRVQTVHLNHEDEERWPVAVDVAVKPDIDIRANATAKITSQGLLGEKYLQIDPGTADHPPLQPSGRIPSTPPMSMDQAMARVDELSGKLSALLDEAAGMLSGLDGRLNRLLDGANTMLTPENAENLSALLESLRSLAETAAPELTTLTRNLEAGSEKMNAAFDDLPEITDRLAALLENLETALGPDGERLSGLLDSTESGMRSAGAAMDSIAANRAEIDRTLADLSDTVSNLKGFAQQINERPYLVIRKEQPADRKPGDGVER